MKLKLNKDGSAAVKDGKPIYVHESGREEAFDGPAAMKLARSHAFAASKYVAEKLSIHHEMAAAFFGDRFRMEDGRLVAYGSGGLPLYSRQRPGELADLDEALEQLVASYPSKDKILRAPSNTGPGAPAGVGQAKATITRKQFDGMSPQDCMNFCKSGGKVVD